MGMTMKRHLIATGGLLIGLLSAGVQADPSSHVVWDSATRHLVLNGDPQRGESKAKVCDSCHTPRDGKPLRPNFPRLAGQNRFYIFKQMMDYRDNTRGHGVMQNFASKLTPQEMADIAAFYASQSLPGAPADRPPAAVARLIARGDARRLIPPCAACHGGDGAGAVVHVPALAGQEPSYFTTTMQAYKSGERANDIYSRMRLIAGELSDDEIDQLARYYTGSRD